MTYICVYIYWLLALQQTSTVKLTVFFWRLLIKIIVRLLLKTLLMEILSRLKVTMNQVKSEKHCFGSLPGFVTGALTIRPRNVYTFVF